MCREPSISVRPAWKAATISPLTTAGSQFAGAQCAGAAAIRVLHPCPKWVGELRRPRAGFDADRRAAVHAETAARQVIYAFENLPMNGDGDEQSPVGTSHGVCL
jgi:hypothetical protein